MYAPDVTPTYTSYYVTDKTTGFSSYASTRGFHERESLVTCKLQGDGKVQNVVGDEMGLGPSSLASLPETRKPENLVLRGGWCTAFQRLLPPA